MKNYFYQLIVVLVVLSFSVQSQCSFTTNITASGPTLTCGNVMLTAGNTGNVWTQKTNYGGAARRYAVAFSIGTKGYIGTGNGSTTYLGDFWEYDPSNNAWTQKANFGGGARYGAVGFSIGTKGYIGTGYNGSYRNDFWEYDPSTNFWTQKANFAGGARYLASAFSLNGKGYIGTGSNGNYLNDFWEYDPSTNFWTQKANVGGGARFAAVGMAINSLGYIGSGHNATFGYVNDFWEYNSSSNTWTQKASIGTVPFYGAVAFSAGGKGFVTTGFETNNSTISDKIWEYNPTNNTWTQKLGIGSTNARYFGAAFAIGLKGYVGTGYTTTFLNSFWEYETPGTYTWSNGANTQAMTATVSGNYSVLITNASGCTATAVQALSLSPNPTISVTGASLSCSGISNTITANGATSYTWSSNAGGGNSNTVILSPTISTTYTLSGSTGSCSVDFPIVLNVNPTPISTIAVSGPTLGCGNVTLSTSGAGDSWTQRVGMNAGRRRSFVFTIGDKAYVGTGSGTSFYMNDFWEYDPNTNAWTQKANFGGTARYGAVGLSIGNKGYAGLGYDGATRNDFWEYDPVLNTWTQKANFGGGIRYLPTGFGIANRGYVGLGNNGSTTHYNDFWEYNPTNNTWIQKNNYGGTSRAAAIGFVINGKAYVGTGSNGSTNYNDFWEYNTSTDTWIQKANFVGGARTSAAGFSIGNFGYIGTGISGTTYYNDFWEYDANNNSWTQRANFAAVSRIFSVGFSLQGKGFLGLGESSSSGANMNDIWRYDPFNTINWSTGSTVSAITVTNTGNYSLTITSPFGCISSSTQSIALSPNPTITVTTPSLVCAGNTYTINANGAGTFTWSSNAGGGNANFAVVTPSASVVYTVSGTTGTCTVDYPINLNVVATPVASIAVSGPTLGCGNLTLSANSIGDTWTQKAGMNFGRIYAVSFSIGNKGYVGTGFNASTAYMNDFWEYDPIVNAWTQKANFAGGGRYGATGFSIGNKGYLGTGYNGTYRNDFWEYDPSTNTWTQKAAFTGNARYFASGWNINNKGYIALGYSGTYYSDLREYDPQTNTWTVKTNFPASARYAAASFVIGNKAFVGTGYSGAFLQDFWEYDQNNNTWLQRANFGGTGRYFSAGFAIGNKGFFATGNDINNVLRNDLWEYNPASNSWLQRNNFSGLARYSAQAVVIQNVAYLTNGYATSPNYPNDLWQYNPANSINWSTASTLQAINVSNSGTYSLTLTNLFGCSANAVQSVSLSPNPTISVSIPTLICANFNSTLVASGANSYTWSANAGGVISSSVIVTPSTYASYSVAGTTGTCTVIQPVAVNVSPTPNSFISVSGPTLGCGIVTLSAGSPGNVWIQKAGLNSGRYLGVAFSIGNRGYFGTGYDANGYLNDFWEYNPANNSWTQKANFAGGARYGAVGFSIDNKGYIGTGYDNTPKNDFWEYDPQTNNWTQKANFAGAVRYYAVGFNIQDKGYIGTGYNGNTTQFYNDFWEYNPSTNTWVQKANFGGLTRYGASGFSIGNRGYLGLGANSPFYSDFWEYNPSNNTWVQKASFPGTLRYFANGVSLYNKGYIGAGYTNQGLNDFWEYDPIFNAWTRKSNIGGALTRAYAAAFSTEGKVYLGTGYSNSSPNNLNDLWEYTPAASTAWSTGSTLQTINAGLSGIYNVTITNQSGCASSSAQTLSLSPNPTITVSGASLVCSGQSYSLLANGAGTFTWSANAGGGNSNSVIVTPSVSTTYSISGTTGTCSITQPIFLDVNMSPPTAIAVSGPTLGCGSLTLSSSTGTGNTWVQKASLITPRQYASAFSVGGKGYISMGLIPTSPNYINDLWEYDPILNSWTQKANFIGSARRGAFAFTIGNMAYIGGGEDGSSYRNDFYEYNPATNAWVQKSNYPLINIGYAAAFTIGTKGYVGTGFISGSGGYTNTFFEYDPSINNWTQKANFAGNARSNAVGFSIGSKGYILTGVGQISPGIYNDMWEYDVSFNTWVQKASIGTVGRNSATGFSIGDYGYVGTGISSGVYVADFWEYKQSTNTWSQKLTFPGQVRVAASGIAISGKGYLGVGLSSSSPGVMNDFWEYNPTINSVWSTGSTLQAITVSTSGNYSITATSLIGCVSTVSQSVALSPNPTVVISGNTGIACAGNPSTLTASGAGSYTWSANAGSSNSNSVIVTPTSTTIYTVSAATGSCIVNTPVELNVYPSPVSTIISAGSGTVCGSSITLSTNVPAGNIWSQKAGLNTGRQGAVAFSIGSKGYIGTGYNGSTSPYYFNDFWEYDPNTNSWTQKASFGGTARYYAVGFSIGAKGYIGTGYDINSSRRNDFWEYDPINNNWTQKANFGGSTRYLATGFSIGNKGYIGTGYDNANRNDFWEYDPSNNTWLQRANFGGTARYLAVGFSISNKGYIGTGYDGSNKFDVWQYDPSVNSWTQRANLGTTGRYAAAAFVLGDRAYVSGGNGLTDVWEYNSVSNIWAQKANFAGGYRNYPVAFSINGKGYFGTGTGSTANYNDLWEYTPQTTYLWSTGSTLQAITATVSGTYSLTLSNIFGCSNTATQVVNIATTPTISIASPTLVCAGSNVTLSAIGANNYTWSSNAGSVIGNSVIINPTSAASYSVIGESNGCTSTAAKAIFVNALPIVVANASTLNICAGNTVNLYGSGAVTYTWTNGVINNAIFTPSITNTYTVYGTDFNVCTNSAVVTVSVNSIPVISVNSGSICQGQSFTITPSGAITYTYSGGSAVVSPITNTNYSVSGTSAAGCLSSAAAVSSISVLASPTVAVAGGSICVGQSFTFSPSGANSYSYSGGSSIVSPSSTTSYTITGTDLNGCSNFIPAVAILTVNNLPNVSAPSGSICAGSSFTINPTGAISYTYSSGSNIVTPGSNTTYSVFGSNTAGCTNSSAALVTVTVNSIPNISVNSGTICQGQSFTITPTGAATYTYSSGSAVVSPMTNTNYSVSGTSAAGCIGSAVVSSISVLASPTVVVAGGSICVGQSFTLSPSGANNFTYSGGSSVVSPITTTSYTITGSNVNGCTNFIPAIASITVNSLPNVSVPSGSICLGNSFTINPTGALNYTYSSGSNVVNPSSTTSYSIFGNNSAGCVNLIPAVMTVTVNSIPTISVNSGTICQGQSFTLTPSGAATYTYSSGSSIVSPLTNTNYSVSGTSAAGCVSSSAAIASINVSASPTLAISSGSICDGESFTLTPSGANSYTFSGGSSIVTPSITSSYTILGADLNGCTNFIPAIATVTVNSLPNVSAPGGTICAGDSFTINPIGASTYTYSSGSNVVSPVSTTNYLVFGTNASGCVNLFAAVVTVSVNTIPTISINSGTICQGQSFTLTPSGASTYTYSSGSAIVSPLANSNYSVSGTSSAGCVSAAPAVANISVLASPTLAVAGGSICVGQSFTLSPSGANSYSFSGGNSVVSPSTTTSYTVTGSDVNGCTNYIPAVAILTVNGLPNVSVPSGSICLGNSFTINPTGALNYTYSSGSNVVSPSSTSSYSVFGTNAAGCVNLTPAVMNVTVNSIPTISVNSGTICQGQSFTLIPSGASSYTYSSGSAIVSPLTNTNYSVSGTSSAGCLSSAPAVANITVLISPTVSVSSGSICLGQSFTLSPNGANSYSYSGGNSVVSPSATTSYTITGSGVNGCTNFIPAVASITVNNLPNVSAPSGSVCFGNSFTINPTGALNYTYSSGSNVVSPSSTTSYSVFGTNGAGCVNLIPAVMTVTVNSIPTISVNSGTICQGQSFTLTPSGAANYTYSSGSAIVSPLTNTNYSVSGTSSAGCVSSTAAVANITVFSAPIVSVSSGSICVGNSFTIIPSGASNYTYTGGSSVVSPTANTTYSVIGSNTLGCLSLSPALVNVTVNQLPVLSASGGSICNGNSYTISPSGANTYTYSSGSNIVTPSVTTSYSITGSFSNGCTNNNSIVVEVTVVANPTINVPSAAIICFGESYTITPSGAITYTYSGGSNVVSPNSSTNYTVTGSSSQGCVGSAIISVSVQPSLTVSITGPTATCQGQLVTLNANGANTFTWNNGATTNSIVFTASTSNVYSVAAGSGNCFGSASISLLVNPNPTITAASSSSLICADESITLTASGANTYNWDNGLTGASIVVNPSVTSTYTVAGVDANGCSGLAIITQSVDACVGVKNEMTNAFSGVKIYPNPSNGQIQISFTNMIKNASVEIYNYIGQLILKEELHALQSDISFMQAANGVYNLRIVANGKVLQNIKLIKQ